MAESTEQTRANPTIRSGQASGFASEPARRLQRHASSNAWRHFWRATRRTGVLIAGDLGSLVSVVWLAGPVAEDAGLTIRPWFVEWPFALAILVGLSLAGCYGPGDRRHDPRRVLFGVLLAIAFVAWAPLTHQPTIGFALTSLAAVSSLWIMLSLVRETLHAVVHRLGRSGEGVARTVLVGPAGDCIDMHDHRALARRDDFDVVGYVDATQEASAEASAKQGTRAARLLGGLEDLEDVLHDHSADTVVLCGHVREKTFTRVVRAAMLAECHVLSVSRTFELSGLRPDVIWRRGQPFIELRAPTLRAGQFVVKRLLDVTVAFVSLGLLTPLLALIAIAIRLESPGRAIFVQTRLGLYGRRFALLKFRSMFDDAEERLRNDAELYQEYVENDYKLPAHTDPRITNVGRWLRRTSVDELPQLWNVLWGDMSLVGPRPIVPDEIRHYHDEAPLLLSLKPGLTGAWQVHGRSHLAYPERAVVELEYVRGWSLMRDVSVLVLTIPVVFSRRGAH